MHSCRQGIPTNSELWVLTSFSEFLEYRRAELADIVNEFLEEASAGSVDASIDLQSVLQTDENERMEFKETARVNSHTGAIDKEMERSVVKTVAAFMNASGGTLVIGVHDGTGELRGLDRDIATLGRKDLDGYEQFLRQSSTTRSVPRTPRRSRSRFPTWMGPRPASSAHRDRREPSTRATVRRPTSLFATAIPLVVSTARRLSAIALIDSAGPPADVSVQPTKGAPGRPLWSVRESPHRRRPRRPCALQVPTAVGRWIGKVFRGRPVPTHDSPPESSQGCCWSHSRVSWPRSRSTPRTRCSTSAAPDSTLFND